MIFEFDKFIGTRPYPNLAKHQAKPLTAEWRQFSQHWPFSEPPNLIEYFRDESVDHSNQRNKYYLISISFFDFSIDWFSLLPKSRILEMQQEKLHLMFFYSEGDNPVRMREHLLSQCKLHNVPAHMLIIISANSAADQLPGCAWFADDELLFRKRNRKVTALRYHENPRSKMFTSLVRTHKWWRATTMAEFWKRGWQPNGYFSYNTEVAVGEPEHENPIEVDCVNGLRSAMYDFLKNCPFKSDNLSSDQHNNHHLCVPEHYNNSYLNIVIETHMDVDQSNGVFLTEKTFKPIKHAQPFVIFGAAHSLARLRDLGYRVFDGVIDNSYDLIEDTTQRWIKLVDILDHMFSQGPDYMHQMLCCCQFDLLHNQQYFLSSKKDRLNNLLRKIG